MDKLWVMPDYWGRINEIEESKVIAEHALWVEVTEDSIVIHDGDQAYILVRCCGVWQGSCTYGQTHDPRTDPCRHVRALEIWSGTDQICDTGLPIPDEASVQGPLFEGQHGISITIAAPSLDDLVRV